MLDEFFLPQSVAVIGASREKGKVGYAVLQNLIEQGYKGKIFPINPQAEEISGYKCYPSVSEIPEKIDLAIVIVPAKFVPSVVQQCAEKKTNSVIIISAGFKEAGPEGAKLEREILGIAQKNQIRVLGPNCLGLINTYSSLNASFAASMPPKGEIAFMSQSGALCTAILDWAIAENIGFSKFVSLGNKADLSEIDFLKAWADDAQAKVILAYLEGVKDGKEFMKIAKEVAKKKPLIIVKSGGTNAGSRAVSSHTGTLAGSEQAYDAAFQQCGIIRAKSIEDLFDYALAFAYQPLPQGKKVALITNAGGPGIMATDACERVDLQLSSFESNTIEYLRKNLPPSANIYNPVDVLGDAPAGRYTLALQTVLKDQGVEAVIVLLTPQAMTEIKDTAENISLLSNNSSKKTIITCFMGEAKVSEGIKILNENKIPNFPFPERAVASLKAMVKHQEWLKEPAQEIKNFPVDKQKVIDIIQNAKKNKYLNLGDLDVREVISAYGFSVPKSKLAKTAEESVAIAQEFGYPVVLKIASPDILHKTDVGGVRVNLENDTQVNDAFEIITMRAQKRMPEAQILGVAVQEMVKKGKEVILGMMSDPQFGPMIMFGLGGIYVEVLKDVSFRIAPLSISDAKKMIKEIKSFMLLKGVRGEKGVDIDFIAESLLRLSQLVGDFPEIVELDINPLVVYEKGGVAIDARLTISNL